MTSRRRSGRAAAFCSPDSTPSTAPARATPSRRSRRALPGRKPRSERRILPAPGVESMAGPHRDAGSMLRSQPSSSPPSWRSGSKDVQARQARPPHSWCDAVDSGASPEYRWPTCRGHFEQIRTRSKVTFLAAGRARDRSVACHARWAWRESATDEAWLAAEPLSGDVRAERGPPGVGLQPDWKGRSERSEVHIPGWDSRGTTWDACNGWVRSGRGVRRSRTRSVGPPPGASGPPRAPGRSRSGRRRTP